MESNNEKTSIPQASIEDLRLDYQQTCAQFRFLADIRFKLLAFVPILTGITITLLSNKVSKESSFLLGILGFIVTIGIVIYDLRNSQFYASTIARARYLESLIHLPNYHHPSKKIYGGIFSERPGRGTYKLDKNFKIQTLDKNEIKSDKNLIKIELWHDKGLALVYSSSLGSWIFIIINYGLSLLNLEKKIIGEVALNSGIAILISFIISIIIYRKYIEIARIID